MFPVIVSRVSLRHRQGTKDYHLLRLTAADGTSVVVNRWGKAEAWGQTKVDRYANSLDAERNYNSKLRQKENGGYERELTKLNTTVVDLDALKGALGAWWTVMGKTLVDMLGGGISKVSDDAFAAEPEPEVTVADRVAANPDWGLF
ncbi:WGR domain-containing protein, predicted DNA-binding domain in MolR [Faunimonas pinastri]|uniref:WGR domain-containing protein, predicted DNA-binding domain in MolR n=1 Tax=Faunimonas pinastri TaxID=1855383 RepID=A0A1H9N083_9HYPH|nr:WGR domain-containing protein [Faunimonas pinastri]SER29342.1 WGR domain-containing protein, predicted DNA-binding domain in MolR [Faunimonas pinastri]